MKIWGQKTFFIFATEEKILQNFLFELSPPLNGFEDHLI